MIVYLPCFLFSLSPGDAIGWDQRDSGAGEATGMYLSGHSSGLYVSWALQLRWCGHFYLPAGLQRGVWASGLVCCDGFAGLACIGLVGKWGCVLVVVGA
jgi:hypothetical protein